MPGRAKSINSLSITPPKTFKKDYNRIIDGGRLAGGLFVADTVARKLKFYLVFDVLTSDEFELILAEIFDGPFGFTFTYEWNGVEYTKDCYSSPISAEEFRTSGKQYVKNVTFNIIEL